MTHTEMLFVIDDDGEKLTEWEVKFVSDLLDREPIYLSATERGKIEEIYVERVT